MELCVFVHSCAFRYSFHPRSFISLPSSFFLHLPPSFVFHSPPTLQRLPLPTLPPASILPLLRSFFRPPSSTLRLPPSISLAPSPSCRNLAYRVSARTHTDYGNITLQKIYPSFWPLLWFSGSYTDGRTETISPLHKQVKNYPASPRLTQNTSHLTYLLATHQLLTT